MTRFDRQSFLGADSESRLYGATLGLVGLGGGGSHIAQQTGHLGIGGYVVVDPDHITETNTNRLIGGTLADLETVTTKVAIAKRLIRALQEQPRIIPVHDTWHNATGELKRCDIIVGALDSFKEREQLERFARRHLIPYIDIGMDVHDLGNKNYLIGGQVILSMPGKACLRCCGLLTEERLALEANKYGAAGSRPQVVWSNGALASAAVGLIAQLLTPWFKEPPEFAYLDYDGNRGTLIPNDRMELLRNKVCQHHPSEETGDPLFDVREFNRFTGDLALRNVKLPSTPAPTSARKRLRTIVARMLGL
ncbi:MAG TPA: ThiF family adenylyltransferase [Candidatus Acidoferrum sp.]|nr:ThiF family adenylyltransferase [Candidatus Acidoferrum sp.]